MNGKMGAFKWMAFAGADGRKFEWNVEREGAKDEDGKLVWIGPREG